MTCVLVSKSRALIDWITSKQPMYYRKQTQQHTHTVTGRKIITGHGLGVSVKYLYLEAAQQHTGEREAETLLSI